MNGAAEAVAWEEAGAFAIGEWIVVSTPNGLTTYRSGHLDEMTITGTLTGILRRDPKALATLAAVGHLDERVQALSLSLRENEPEPLTFDRVLRGDGWDTIFLELTGQCNEACVHCYAESSPERQERLALDEVLSVIRQARTLGFRRLQLTGGDPLVSKTYLAAARLAYELNFPHIEVFTNGLALSDQVADDLARYGVTFSFSFYSHRPEVHDGITRTPGSQPRTLAAIRRVLERGLSLRVGIIATETNRDDVEETWLLLRKAGVPSSCIGVDQEREVGRGTFRNSEANLAGQFGTPDGERTLGDPTEIPGGSSSTHGAARGGGKVCVSYSGAVYPCIFARGRPLGSIRAATLVEILGRGLRVRAPSILPVFKDEEARLTCFDCRARDRLLAQLEATPVK